MSSTFNGTENILAADEVMATDPVDNQDADVYNTNLQIAGVFIIVVASISGMGLSYLFGWIKSKGGMREGGSSEWIFGIALELLKGCGLGVIICTSLIHLIGEAYEPFEESGMAETYEQWPMVFAMIGMFIMAILEFFHHRFEARSRLADEDEEAPTGPGGKEMETYDNPVQRTASGRQVATSSYRTMEMPSIQAKAPPTVDKGIKAKQRNAVLVEGSILIHSVLIGFDLGLQTEKNWITLIIAISFHQFFEGFAVGQIVLDAQFGFWKKVAMISFYSLTTSVGICIGIGTYLGNGGDSGETQSVLITIGVIDAICGGLLLFAGMSVFWTEWYVNNHEHHIADSLFQPAIGFLGVAIGMAIMAVIGIWA